MGGSSEFLLKNKNVAIACGAVASGALVVGGAVAAGIAFKKHNDKKAMESHQQQNQQAQQQPQQPKQQQNTISKPRCESERVFHGAEFRRLIDVLKVMISQLKTRDGEERALFFCDVSIAICNLAKGMILIELDNETLPSLKAFALRHIWFVYNELERPKFNKALITNYRDVKPVQHILNLINQAHQKLEINYHQMRNRLTLEQNRMLTAIDYNFGFVV